MKTQTKPLHANVSRIARSLMAARGYDQQRLAEALGIQQPALSKRLGGYTDWSIEDIAAMSDLFDVSEAIFFADADDLFAGVDTSTVRRAPLVSPTPPRRKTAKVARSRCFLPGARRPLPNGGGTVAGAAA